MRLTSVFCLLASPALGWEFSPSPICTLTNADRTMTVTHDAVLPEYAIHVTHPEGWRPAPVFAIRFDGPSPLIIRTDRHVISADDTTLTVRDRGFGNVLAGLGRNTTASALLGDQVLPFDLTGIVPALADFIDCPQALSS